MSTETRTILWGIDRPDGSPVRKSPTFGSDFWAVAGAAHGFRDGHRGAAEKGAAELTDALVHLGVRPAEAQHMVVRIVVTTTTERQTDWIEDAPEAGGTETVLCTCGHPEYEFPAQHATLCPRFAAGRDGGAR
jgi:hypothetical protein